VICIPITAGTQAEALRDMEAGIHHADVIELRMDLVRDGDLKILMDAGRRCPVPVKILVTNRQGRNSGISIERKRIAILKEAVALGADFVDVELSVTETLRQEILSTIREYDNRTTLIVSHHDFKKTPSEKALKTIFHGCVRAGADIVKIVSLASRPEDNLKILNLIGYARKKNQDIIAFCMGEKGRMSRIMAPLLGSLLSFTVLERGAESAPGQLTVEEMKRAMEIIKNTSPAGKSSPAGGNRVFALYGNPVKQSLSPLMHNATFARMNIAGTYVPFCVRDLESAVHGVRGMDIRGVSVTIPFKVSIMVYLDEVDDDAVKIGAVNTLVNDNGRLRGCNTDWMGLVQSLENVFDIKGKVFAILGAGGTARAAIYGILKKGGVPVILNRNTERGESLAREWGCSFYPLNEAGNVSADCLINTTSVGMMPDTEKSPVDSAILKKFPLVVDVIYNPLRTKLLRDAEIAGCITVPGLDMFVHQGAEQIKLWTGQEPPRAFMRQIVAEKLRSHGDDGN
jgi:shikimate dehydrogenase/3-dehydroquinate dehydratase type I